MLKPCPGAHPKRLITTKLGHFAHTTSPTASAAASPGKQHMSAKKRRRSGHLSSTIHNSDAKPSYLTALCSNKKGSLPLANSRPNPTLSSFATMKRVRTPSPVHPFKPAKRHKTDDATLAKNAGTPVFEGATVETQENTGSLVPEGAATPIVGGAKSRTPCSNEAGTSEDTSQLSVERERTAPTSSALSPTVGETSSRHRNGKHGGGAKVTSEAESRKTPPATFRFEQLFGYYPPKLTLQDGDLCPERSLSLSGMERSKLSNLPPAHPFWNWTLGQPINKAAAPSIKTSRRKQKSKATNNVA